MTIRNIPPVPDFSEWITPGGGMSEAGHNYLARLASALSDLKRAVEDGAESGGGSTLDPVSSMFFSLLFRAELLATGSWNAPWNCYARVWLIGGGGSGGAARFSGGAKATGGGGAELAIKERIFVPQGAAINFEMGAGGTSVANNGSATVGVPGGTSYVTGPNGFAMSANGGQGGFADGSSAASAPGGFGGTGGDTHYPGQASAARTSNGGTSGGCFGIVASPSAAADNTATAQEVLSQLTSLIDVWQWITRDNFFSGAGTTSTGAEAGGRGCGGGGGGNTAGSGTMNSGAGGDGFCIIDYTAPVEILTDGLS